MRSSAAESRGHVNSFKGDSGAKGSSGYALRPAGQASAQMVGVPAGELRLGKLQVVVWLGLALGSIVGAYFVGYFSGRYVGFESARESSLGEMAKLPAPEALQGSGQQNPGGVYEKLKGPAALREPERGTASEKPRSIGSLSTSNSRVEVAKEEVEELGIDASEAEVGRDAKTSERSSQPARSEAVASDSDINAIVEDDTSGPQLIIGDDSAAEQRTIPSSVRMLGSSEGEAQKGAAVKAEAPAKSDKSPSALLDERIANARNDSAKTGQPSLTAASKGVEKAKVDGGQLVRKVLPSGYFAQVAAPKKLSEAEAIAGKLKRSGFPVVVESASVAGQSFYRVVVGPEQNKVQADRLVSQLKGESYLTGDPFLRKVK